MKKSNNLLDDGFYNAQIERMNNLARAPQAEPVKREYRRVLRRISESDGAFINRLISDVIDTNEKCPTPAELIRRAGEMRSLAHSSVGEPDCEQCHGTGFIHYTRRVSVPGLGSYDADASKPCACRGQA